jgi:hypothetical protein
MKNVTKIILAAGLFIAAAGFVFTSCTKEGPQGPSGTNGKNGTDGKDASETCKQCHAPSMVDKVLIQFEMSKHNWGTTAFEEAGGGACTSCHTNLGYIYVCQNNTPATFSFTGGKWVNNYIPDASNQFGAIGCWTCHSSLHTTYTTADLAFTNTAPVSMTMWAGAKTINLAQDSGMANLCVKCHQPRPLTCGYDPTGRVLNYDSLVSNPGGIAYDSTTGVHNTGVKPSYRTHVHYGAVGAVFAGVGAIEFPGTLSYGNSYHTTHATCQDCHMSEPMTGIAGGHSFNMRNAKETPLSSSTTWNFNGCNVANCHADDPLNANHPTFKNTRAGVKVLLESLAAKINEAGQGHDILHKETTSANLWAGITDEGYDGYLDIFDAASNPGGYWKMTGAQPKFPALKNVQLGAIINFQFCLREYSLGIHNTTYVTALMTNTIQALNAAGL